MKHASLTRPQCAAVLFALVVLAVDQLSKWWILFVLDMPARQFIEVTSFFNLVMVWNQGISFGMFSGGGIWRSYVLIAIALLMCVFLWCWLKQATRGYVRMAIGLVLGGAIGNVIDRARFGAVVDFLDFHIAGYHWPTFNIADSAICIGVALLCIDTMISPHRSTSSKES